MKEPKRIETAARIVARSVGVRLCEDDGMCILLDDERDAYVATFAAKSKAGEVTYCAVSVPPGLTTRRLAAALTDAALALKEKANG